MTWRESAGAAASEPRRRRREDSDLELWANCPTCERWYFVPSGTLGDMCASRCPVCHTQADRFQERHDDRQFDVEVS